MSEIKKLAFSRPGLNAEIAKLRDGWHQVESRDGSGEIVWRNAKDFCEFDEICSPDWTGHFPAAIELFWELPMPRCLMESSATETAVSWHPDGGQWNQVVCVDCNIAICAAWHEWKTGIQAEVFDAD